MRGSEAMIRRYAAHAIAEALDDYRPGACASCWSEAPIISARGRAYANSALGQALR